MAFHRLFLLQIKAQKHIWAILSSNKLLNCVFFDSFKKLLIFLKNNYVCLIPRLWAVKTSSRAHSSNSCIKWIVEMCVDWFILELKAVSTNMCFAKEDSHFFQKNILKVSFLFDSIICYSKCFAIFSLGFHLPWFDNFDRKPVVPTVDVSSGFLQKCDNE